MPTQSELKKDVYKIQVTVITSENRLSTFLGIKDALEKLPYVLDVSRIRTRIN